MSEDINILKLNNKWWAIKMVNSFIIMLHYYKILWQFVAEYGDETTTHLLMKSKYREGVYSLYDPLSIISHSLITYHRKHIFWNFSHCNVLNNCSLSVFRVCYYYAILWCFPCTYNMRILSSYPYIGFNIFFMKYSFIPKHYNIIRK